MDVLLFGCGIRGKELYSNIDKDKVNVLSFLDNNPGLSETFYDGIKIVNPSKVNDLQFDFIVITTENDKYITEIKKQLRGLCVDEDKILCPFGDEDINKIPSELLMHYEYRYGCRGLGEKIVIDSEYISFCCSGAQYGKRIRIKEDVVDEDILKNYLKDFRILLDDTLKKMRTGMPNFCDGCHSLKKGLYPKQPKLTSVTLGVVDLVCNCRCIYCTQFYHDNHRKNKFKFKSSFSGGSMTF